MARPFSRALGVGLMGVGRWRIAWVVASRKVVRGSWVVGRDGPVDPVDRVIRVWPCALRRRASLVTRHSSVVGSCSSLFVVVGPTSAGPIGPNELPRSLRDTPRPFPHFLLASLWTSWVRSAQTVDPSRFCRIGRINGSRCRSMPRVPARRAFGRTPLAGLRASAHRIAAALVHIFCGQACGHPTHPPHNPLIRRHFSRHARKEATRPPRTNRRAPPRPRP